MKILYYLALPFVFWWSSSTMLAAEDGNVEMGRDIAEEYCVQCHDISESGSFKMDPPSFAAIAKFRSRMQIMQRIEMPVHSDMPRYSDYMIGGNIGDMVAYIISLEE
ncbi:c-type cytochrome [Ruegeria hyattellae]|uniref:c-type cytochrome n=1 Tax=Ruegeria hyattellae TaxID=3233337 RepID=UPI00355B59B2